MLLAPLTKLELTLGRGRKVLPGGKVVVKNVRLGDHSQDLLALKHQRPRTVLDQHANRRRTIKIVKQGALQMAAIPKLYPISPCRACQKTTHETEDDEDRHSQGRP